MITFCSWVSLKISCKKYSVVSILREQGPLPISKSPPPYLHFFMYYFFLAHPVLVSYVINEKILQLDVVYPDWIWTHCAEQHCFWLKNLPTLFRTSCTFFWAGILHEVQTHQNWYFVSKIVLTYCENKIVLLIVN